jgi:hypothetical protein
LSDDTLLTRDDLGKMLDRLANEPSIELYREFEARLRKTIDAAHGVLREEMRAAAKGALETMLAQKVTLLEQLGQHVSELEQLHAEKEKEIERLQGLVRSAEPGTESMCPWCRATVVECFDEGAVDQDGTKGALVGRRSPKTPHKPDCRAAEYFGDGRWANWRGA